MSPAMSCPRQLQGLSIQEMMGHLFKGGCMHHFETLLYIPSEYVVDQTVYVFLVIAYEL